MTTAATSSFALMAEHSELHRAGFRVRSIHLRPVSPAGQVRLRLVWRHHGRAAVVRQAGMTEGAAQALLAYLMAPGLVAGAFLAQSLAVEP